MKTFIHNGVKFEVPSEYKSLLHYAHIIRLNHRVAKNEPRLAKHLPQCEALVAQLEKAGL